MAKLDMKDYTSKILVEAPRSASGLQTFIVDGASELRPGYACTNIDHAAGYIGKPDAADEGTVGIVLDNPHQDIDAYFPDGEVVTVAMCRSGAVAWGYSKSGETYTAGQRLENSGAANDGYIGYGENAYEYVGVAAEQMTVSVGNTKPVMVRLD